MSLDMEDIIDAYREAWEQLGPKDHWVSGSRFSSSHRGYTREILVGYMDYSTGEFIDISNVALYLEMVNGWRDVE